MKKFIKGILASVLAFSMVVALGACNKDNKAAQETTQATTQETQAPAVDGYAGTWKLTGAEAGGVVINDFSQLSQLMGEEMDMSLTLGEDGTASAVFNGEKNEGAKWQEKDGNIVISGNGSSDGLTFKIEGNTLVVEEESDGMKIKMIFTKQ